MPRPKRTKVNRSAPAPAQRVTYSTEPVATEPVPAAAPAARPFNDLYDVSDDDRNKSASAKKSVKGKAVATRTSGRKTASDIDDTKSRKAVNTANQKNAPNVESGDDAMEVSSSPEVEAGRRGRLTLAMDNSVLAIGNFRRRAREPSILGQQGSRARSSSIDSDLAEENGLTSVGKSNTSGLGLGTFRGRPGSRRPSSVAGDRPEIGSVLRLGNFKRRAREPSILGTARKPEQARPTFDSDSDSDDFAPEDESTPLNFTKGRAVPSSSSSRKRKLSNVQVPRSQQASQAQQSPSKLPVNDSDPEDTVLATAPIESDEEEENDLPELDKESSPNDSPLPFIERITTPEPMSETMAPPRGSSSSLSPAQSLPSPPPPPQLTLNLHQAVGRTRRNIQPRTPPRVANSEMQSSPISSPPSLTHSPDIPTRSTSKRATRKVAPQPATLSTAALQALLPRRRQRHRSALDVESDGEVNVTGLGEHDDELTITVAPTTRRQASARSNPRAPASPSKPSQKAKPTAKGKGKRTYGRKPATTTSDKENEADQDDSLAPIQDTTSPEEPRSENSSELEKRVGKELKKAARKFQEVDKWELDFEECEASSDQLAR
ncbi:e90657bb-fb5e-4664-8720-6684baaabb64 [Sclerotinia trifoliorum]|uniref:E90657bb-fb5e-4664-8720-6684baaabb64 n=1 Tax=Sclerotinia trifoliorum TaxID=28548 RepID=A0A8H2VVT5_9HELO|nr:e90657bb-fb5e-4664-8720-6684baaabb64 [Sclerotinia trifoliorum]